MTKPQFTLRSIRALKGAPLSAFLLLFFTKKALPQNEIEMYTGYSKRNVDNALTLLEEIGWVKSNQPYMWEVAVDSDFLETVMNDDPSAKAVQFRPSKGMQIGRFSDGYIYLAQMEDGSHKIGRTIDVDRRLSELRSRNFGQPIKLVWSKYFKNADLVESDLHFRFREKQSEYSTERFFLDEDDIQQIKSL
jgi:hypothetical protein